MEENLSPGEKRAEAYRQRVQELGRALTTEELLEAAKAVSKAAGRVIAGNRRFLVKAKGEIDKAKNQPE